MGLGTEVLLGVIAVALAVAVFRDADRLGVRPGLLPGLLRWGPVGWAVGSLLLGVVAVPFYAFHARPRLVAALRAGPGGEDIPVPSRLFPVLAALGTLAMLALGRTALEAATRQPPPAAATEVRPVRLHAPAPDEGLSQPRAEYPDVPGWPRSTMRLVFGDCSNRHQQEDPDGRAIDRYRFCNCVLAQTVRLFPPDVARSNPTGVVRQNGAAYASCPR